MTTRLLLTAAAILSLTVLPSAQSDLDTLMSEVLARRDQNWKKLQQYTLREDNALRVVGPMETLLYGLRRQYVWVPRDGFFVRSPVEANGVTIGEEERRRAEEEWLAQESRRERRRPARRGEQPPDAADAADADTTEAADVPDVIRQSVEPQFVSAAYFLDFRFEGGHYALVGRERLLDRDVLKVEYYPEQLFRPGRGRGRGEADRRSQEEEARIRRQMNKVSLVTLWVEPQARQILQYEFQNVDADFLPGRWLLRLDEITASMRMGTPFPDVWLPSSLRVQVEMTLAIGRVAANYDVTYSDYRLAETGARVVVP